MPGRSSRRGRGGGFPSHYEPVFERLHNRVRAMQGRRRAESVESEPEHRRRVLRTRLEIVQAIVSALDRWEAVSGMARLGHTHRLADGGAANCLQRGVGESAERTRAFAGVASGPGTLLGGSLLIRGRHRMRLRSDAERMWRLGTSRLKTNQQVQTGEDEDATQPKSGRGSEPAPRQSPDPRSPAGRCGQAQANTDPLPPAPPQGWRTTSSSSSPALLPRISDAAGESDPTCSRPDQGITAH